MLMIAELPEQPALYVSPFKFLIGIFRTCCGPLVSAREGAGLLVYRRPDRRNDPDRNCITVDRVRYVILWNTMCTYRLEPCYAGSRASECPFRRYTQSHSLLHTEPAGLLGGLMSNDHPGT